MAGHYEFGCRHETKLKASTVEHYEQVFVRDVQKAADLAKFILGDRSYAIPEIVAISAKKGS